MGHVFTLLYRELIWPCRRTWAGLSAAWVVILGFNLGSSDNSDLAARGSAVPTQELRAALEQRREWIAEFALLPPAEFAEPPLRKPQPRSDRRPESACA